VPADKANLEDVRVLIVEDHLDSMEVLVQALEFCRATVRGVRSAEEAVTHLAEVDVVVTDLTMPRHDGIWLLEHIRRLPGRIRVLALTGVSAQHDPRLAIASFDRVLLKPLDPFHLCDEIEAVLRE